MPHKRQTASSEAARRRAGNDALPPISDWVAPVVIPDDNLLLNLFHVEPHPTPDEILLDSWTQESIPDYASNPLPAAHWSASPVGQETFEDVAGFHARAAHRERKEQVRLATYQAPPGEGPIVSPSSDEDEPVLLGIRRVPRPVTPVDPVVIYGPIELSNPPLKPLGEREAWYKSASMPDSKALSSYSRSRSRSLSRRVRPADRKRVRTPSRSHSPVRSASRVSTTRALLELREILLAQQTLTLEFTRRTLALERHAYPHSPSRHGRSVNRERSPLRAFYGHF